MSKRIFSVFGIGFPFPQSVITTDVYTQQPAPRNHLLAEGFRHTCWHLEDRSLNIATLPFYNTSPFPIPPYRQLALSVVHRNILPSEGP